MQILWQNYRLYYRIKEAYELIRMDGWNASAIP